MTEEQKYLRKQFVSTGFRKRVILEKPHVCANCGSEEGVEFHHIVPIMVGGTNRMSNIVPLCGACHMAVHFGEPIARYKSHKRSGGRPRKLPDDYKNILTDYVMCRIPKSEAQRKIGIGSNICDTVWFKEFIEENGIAEYKNNLDILMSFGTVPVGRKVGYIRLDGDKRMELYADREFVSDRKR